MSSPRRCPVAVFLTTAFLLGACALPELGAPPAEILHLTPGAVYEHTLAPGESRRFRFESPADRLVRLAVEQRGVDVVVRLVDPRGRTIFEIDSPTGTRGSEEILAVTPFQGSYDLVIEPLQETASGDFALHVIEARPATDEDRLRSRATAARARGDLARFEDDFAAAAEAYEQALEPLEALGPSADAATVAQVRWRHGECLLETGEIGPAARVLERAVIEFQELGDPRGEARALNDLGAARRNQGRFGPAARAYERAFSLYRELGVQNGQASALNNLGLVLERTGDFDAAIDHYDEARKLWRRLGEESAEMVTVQNLGRLYSLVGRDQDGLDHLTRAVEHFTARGDEDGLTSAWVALGWATYLAGDPEEALDRYAQALELARRRGDRVAEAEIFGRRATALVALGRLDEAVSDYARALGQFEAMGQTLSQGHTRANLGWVHLETGDARAARRDLKQALEVLLEAGDPSGEFFARVGLGRAQRMLSALEAAQAQLEAAARLVETLRGELRGGMSRSFFLAAHYDVYEELVELLMERHARDPDGDFATRALEVVERARARSLLEELASDKGLDTSDLDRRQRVAAEMEALEQRRSGLGPRDPGRQRVERRLRELSLELDRLGPRMGSTPVRPLSVRRMQALLDDESILVAYFLAEPESFAWSVDGGSIEVHRLTGKGRIRALAGRLRSLLPKSDEVAFQGLAEAAAADLSGAVLDPLVRRIEPYRRLIVLADDVLHTVPFQVLGRRPLVFTHEVVSLPSATVLDWQRRRLGDRSPAPATIAVVADPVYSPEDERLGGRGHVDGPPADLRRALDDLDLEDLERLPGIAREAEGILALVPPEGSLAWLGFEARRELVTSGSLARFRIVHFATHGLVDPGVPELSGLVLSLFDPQGRPRPGFLRAPEVAQLDLPAELVVLSACRTGRGREIRGEGIVGLPQAFFRAGARRVVLSLWSVGDESTADLMERFYQGHLSRGLPPAAALRRAQLAMIAEGFEAPAHWAGFSIHGEWK